MWYVCNRYTSFPSKIRFLASVLDVLFVHYVAYCYIRGCSPLCQEGVAELHQESVAYGSYIMRDICSLRESR